MAVRTPTIPGLPTTPFNLTARAARDLMTPSPACVFASDPLGTATEALRRYSAVAVVDLERKLVGVLSRTDLLRRHGESTVADLMTARVITVGPDTSAVEIVKLLSDNRIGRVFVVDHTQHLVGVVSTTDVLARLRPA